MLTYEILLVIAALCGNNSTGATSSGGLSAGNRLACAAAMIECYKKSRIAPGPEGIGQCVKEVRADG
jgi:hypothetical protein